MSTRPPTLVLCDKRWLHFWKPALIVVALYLVIAIAGTAFAVFVILRPPSEKLPALLERLPLLLAELPELLATLPSIDWVGILRAHFDGVLLMLLLGAQILYVARAKKLERLTLSPTGISYTSPLPAMLKRFMPDWSLSWHDISKVEMSLAVTGMRGPEFAVLTLVSSAGRRKVFPDRWVDGGNFKQSVFRLDFRRKSATPEEIVRSVMASPVARYIAEHQPHIPFDAGLQSAPIYTSLEKDPHGRIALGIVALLMLYAFVDFLAGPDAYVELPFPWAYIFIVPGIAATILCAAWLQRSALTPGERGGLAFLIGMLVAVAMIPGALRLNALTDTAGPTVYDYHVSTGKHGVLLSPATEGMPAIDYFSRHKYWDQFGDDAIYPVQIRKGALGFYQFNASAIVDELRKYDGR